MNNIIVRLVHIFTNHSVYDVCFCLLTKCGVPLFLIRNIGQQTLPKTWVWVFTSLVRNVHSRGKTELILTVKMETRHPVEGQFNNW